MTREEAIEIIKNYDVYSCGYCHQGGDEVEEAFDLAIKVLEQEPCEDAISRQAALDTMYALCDTGGELLKRIRGERIHILMPLQMRLIIYHPSHHSRRQSGFLLVRGCRKMMRMY